MMKIKLFALTLLAVLTLSFAACAQNQPGEVSWDVPIDNFTSMPHPDNDEVFVPAGDTFKLALGSNPTTGFSWSGTATIDDAAILKQLNHEYVAPEGEMVGASGKEVWEFTALEKGTTTVYLEYGRPWEGGEKAVWTYKVTVNVE